MARRYPLIYQDGIITESSRNLLAGVFINFPSSTVGGLVTASTTDVECFGDLVDTGVGDEELVAPLRLQVSIGVTATITILRIKSDGSEPLITDTDCFLAVLTGGGFAIFDEVNSLNKLFYHFDTTIASPTFVWSAGTSGETTASSSVVLPLSTVLDWDMIDITASGVAESLPSVASDLGVMVSNPRSNGVSIFIGFDNTVTNTKYFLELEPGFATTLLLVSNANEIWVYAVFTIEQHKYSYVVL